MPFSDRLLRAIQQFRNALDPERVQTGDDVLARYGSSTSAVTRSVPAAIFPRSEREVAAAMQIARKEGVSIYPISTGRNWGYGCATPIVEDCVLVDLSLMTQIVAMDEEAGTVTIEPGVTQRHLYEYLTEHQLPFLVPVTGAGPDCSLMGNALERGYGITPYADHFGAVTCLEAVLPSGEIYRSALCGMGGAIGTETARLFKWGLGPYLDGIFTQSNIGIVTQITLALARKAEHTEAFFFSVEDDASLEEAVWGVRETLRSLGGFTSGINLLNARRVLAMATACPESDRHRAMDHLEVERLRSKHQVGAWMGMGSLYGPKEIVRAARRSIRRNVGFAGRRLQFFDRTKVQWLSRWITKLPFGLAQRFAPLVQSAAGAIDVMSGVPSEVALPLAYWKSNRRPPAGQSMNPQRDGCGLIWYTPLVPMKPERVRLYSEMVHRICLAHQIDPLITLTSLSERCFDSSVPLLFDRNNVDETDRARACHAELLREGIREGFVPYRSATHTMKDLPSSNHAFWQLASTIKSAIDPEDILAPGRYSKLKTAVAE